MFGKASGTYSASLELSSLNGTNGFVINGIDASDYSGRSVSSAGDINNDGYDDIIIGAGMQTLMVTTQVSPMSCLARHQELTQHLSNCRL